ncbi:MAG: response regulator [Polyangiales bacterium]
MVDDDPTVTEQFAALLREAGMEVYTCGDGETALREARRLRPDVVVSDILMPGSTVSACAAIRRET